MPKCSVCNSVTSNLKIFKNHVRLYRHVPLNGRYVCVEDNCYIEDPSGLKERREFSKLGNLLRHFKEQHSFVESIEPFVEGDPTANVSFENEPEAEFGQDEAAPFDTEFNVNQENFFETNIKSHINIFLCKLYAKPNVPRNVIQLMVDHTSLLIHEIVTEIQEKVSYLMRDQNLSIDEKNKNFKTYCLILKNPFQDLMTEYQRLKFFQSQETYIPPVPKSLYSELIPQRSKDSQHFLELADRSLQFVPLRLVLRQFLQQPGVIDRINSHLQRVVSETDGFMTDFVQGTLWRSTIGKIETAQDNTLIWPLFFYADDYECGNVLGSHKGVHKLCGNYVSIPALPPEFNAMLNNMFLLAIYHAEDRKVVPNSILYRSVVEEFKFLGEEGISIDTPNFKGKIKFVLGLILGDNLGVHQICGFIECFTANFPCRYCRIPRKKLLISKKLDLTQYELRTIDNYRTDIEKNNPSETGINENSLWNELPYCHVTENVPPDLMHDLLESGVATFTLELILKFAMRHGYTTLPHLNRIIRDQNYGVMKNKPPPIVGTNQQPSIKMSAAEMLNFTVFFGIIMGHFFPENDPVWKMYILLRKIMDILFSPRIHLESLEILKSLIEEHHSLYIQFSEEKHLRNKHHHLLHYPDLILKYGPPIKYSAIRYEAFHQRGKQVAVSVASRRNLPKTVLTRNQLLLHSYLQSGDVLKDRL
nr:PREDICTED: uncharacterized protein LOC109040177 isoform X1 [Bemisia tabaci]